MKQFTFPKRLRIKPQTFTAELLRLMNRRFFFPKFSAPAALCLSLAIASPLSAQNQNSEPQLLFENITPELGIEDRKNFQIQDPKLTHHGSVAVATYTATIEGLQEALISYRIDLDSGWEEPLPIESIEFEESFEPVAEFDEDGKLSMAWVSILEVDGESKHYLRYRSLGQEAETIVFSPLPIETPTLVHHNGAPMIAWTEGEAGVFLVFIAEQIGDDWKVTSLSDSVNSYDILPQALETNPTSVYWYSLNQDGFSIKGIQRKELGWIDFTPSLASLPSDRLPYLFALNNIEEPGAIWVEPLSDGEQLFYYDPRLIEDFAITALPSRTGFHQVDPDASSTSEIAFAWVEDSIDDTHLRILARGQEFTIDSIKAPSQPRILWQGSNELIVSVISDDSLGGTGALYSIDVKLNSE